MTESMKKIKRKIMTPRKKTVSYKMMKACKSPWISEWPSKRTRRSTWAKIWCLEHRSKIMRRWKRIKMETSILSTSKRLTKTSKRSRITHSRLRRVCMKRTRSILKSYSNKDLKKMNTTFQVKSSSTIKRKKWLIKRQLKTRLARKLKANRQSMKE